MNNHQKWIRILWWLRREFPSTHKVTVRTVANSSKTSQGEIEKRGHTFEIRISKQCFHLKIDSLIHEWAHLLTWHGNDEDEHGEEWALMFGKIYRAFILWDLGKEK